MNQGVSRTTERSRPAPLDRERVEAMPHPCRLALARAAGRDVRDGSRLVATAPGCPAAKRCVQWARLAVALLALPASILFTGFGWPLLGTVCFAIFLPDFLRSQWTLGRSANARRVVPVTELPRRREASAGRPCGREGCGESMACSRSDCPISMDRPEEGMWRWTVRASA